MNESVYFGAWTHPNVLQQREQEALERDFDLPVALPASITILFASYEEGTYYGHAYVLFEEHGKLYEVAASHCSCNGLGGQWEPTETTPAAARTYLSSGNWYVSDTDAKAAVLHVLDVFEQRVGERA